jgi:tetratricopeptide (TPR) repeat protein
VNFERALEILKKAEGDEASVRLASVDLQFPDLPETERARLRQALEAAAVPHWFDDQILAALLNVTSDDAAQTSVRLRQLSVVEPFSARGPGASNVHEKSRLALRARMKREAPERLRELSSQARSCFAGEEPHLRIEALYHRFTAEPEAAPGECRELYHKWKHGGRYEALLALGVALDELVSDGSLGGLLRSVALYRLAKIRYDYQPREVTARQAAEALPEFESRKDLWQIANTQELLGDVEFDRGNLELALARYRLTLTTRESFAAQAPTNTARQRNLSVSYNRVGDVQSVQGDLAGALKSYRDSLAIREKLAKRDPGNAGRQRDLSVSYEKVGDVQSVQGDLAGALKSYRDSFAIREKLTKQDPGNAGWQRDLSVSYEKVGDVQRARGDLASALKSYRDELAIAEKLAKQDPGNTGWQRVLSVSYEKVGDMQSAQGDLAGALKSYRYDLAIREMLAKQDSGNAGWQGDMAFSYWRVGMTLARAERESNMQAREMIENGRDILRQLKQRTGLTGQQQQWLEAIEADLRKMHE